MKNFQLLDNLDRNLQFFPKSFKFISNLSSKAVEKIGKIINMDWSLFAGEASPEVSEFIKILVEKAIQRCKDESWTRNFALFWRVLEFYPISREYFVKTLELGMSLRFEQIL